MNYQEHLKEFEKLVHEHCHVRYDLMDGSERIDSGMASLMIAFEEYYNKFLKPNELRAVNRNEAAKEVCDGEIYETCPIWKKLKRGCADCFMYKEQTD